MRFLVLVLLASAAFAQPKQLDLRGDRFPGLKYDQMTPEQKAATDRAMAGRGPIGTFNILLRDPELLRTLQAFGGARAKSSLSDKLNELAILITARFWTTQFEWYVHHPAAVKAGVTEATVSAIAEGRRPANLPADEEVVYNFLRELFTTKQVSDATFAAAKDKLGERGIVDIFGIVGSYQVTSMLMNVDRYPMQNSTQIPELKPLARPLP